MQPKIIEKYFFFGLLFAILIFTFFVFRPFLIVLILGASISIILYPIFAWFQKKHLPNWLAAFITLFFFIILLCVPLFGIGSMIFNQSQNLYHSVVNNGDVFPFITSIGDKINLVLPEGVSFNTKEQVSNFVSFLTNNLTNIFNATISVLFSFLLLLLTIFYFLKDGEKWKEAILRLSPLSNTADQKIISKLSQTINGVMKGTLFIAFIQGILMSAGLTIFGIQHAAIWGAVAAIASLIPSVGTALVSVPAIIFLFATNHTVPAIGLAVWAIFMVGTIDNFLAPYIIGRKINIPSFLILFSVLGGIALLGPVGILIGPLAVSLLYTLTEIYQSEFK